MSSDERFDERGETPTIEVRVYRDAVLVGRELCESEEQAALVIDAWSEIGGVTCEVDDLTTRHRPGDIFEPEPAEAGAEDYPEQAELAEPPHRYD